MPPRGSDAPERGKEPCFLCAEVHLGYDLDHGWWWLHYGVEVDSFVASKGYRLAWLSLLAWDSTRLWPPTPRPDCLDLFWVYWFCVGCFVESNKNQPNKFQHSENVPFQGHSHLGWQLSGLHKWPFYQNLQLHSSSSFLCFLLFIVVIFRQDHSV